MASEYNASLEKPRFRPLQAVPFEEAGQQYLALIDPTGIIPDPVILMPDAIVILLLQNANGERTVAELAEIIRRETDYIVTPDKVRHVLSNLDKRGLLQSRRLEEMIESRETEYREQPTRKALLFQSQEPEAARQFLRQELARHTLMPDSPPAFMDLIGKGKLRALLTPHIDYMRGGTAYAWGYKALQQTTKPKTVIILGTLHTGSDEFFIATDKPFETALGITQVDQELLGEIERLYKGELRVQEYLHSIETTIELQVTYLQHIYKDHEFKIVPILVGNFDFMLEDEGHYPEDHREVASFISTLRTILEKRDDVILLGGVDLSHCGPEFGDDFLVTPDVEEEIREMDYEMLDTIQELNPKAFFDHFRESLNERRVCSIAPIYTIMKAIEGKTKPEILAYRQANSKDLDCLVTFCSVAFFQRSLIIL